LEGNWIDEAFAPMWRNYIDALSTSLFNLIDQKDSLIWSFNPSGNYAPKHRYTTLILEHIDDPAPWWGTTLWKLKCPAKSKMFMWLLLTNKSPTWENMQKQSFVRPSRCALYKQDNETISHLFLHCPFTKVI
jgi:hypothetical protein